MFVIKYECEEQPNQIFYLEQVRDDGSIEWTRNIGQSYKYPSRRYIIDQLVSYGMLDHLNKFASSERCQLKTKLSIVEV